VRHFWHAVGDTLAPVHWEAELANAIWMAVRTGALPRGQGHQSSIWPRAWAYNRFRSGHCGNLP
jgi:hypothetical protein